MIVQTKSGLYSILFRILYRILNCDRKIGILRLHNGISLHSYEKKIPHQSKTSIDFTPKPSIPTSCTLHFFPLVVINSLFTNLKWIFWPVGFCSPSTASCFCSIMCTQFRNTRYPTLISTKMERKCIYILFCEAAWV